MRMNLWPAILRPWPWMVKILDTDREKYSSQAKIFQTRAPAATGACTAAVPGAGRGAWQLWPPSPTPAPTSPPASTLASTQVLCSKHQIFLLSMHLFSYFPSKYFFFKILFLSIKNILSISFSSSIFFCSEIFSFYQIIFLLFFYF